MSKQIRLWANNHTGEIRCAEKRCAGYSLYSAIEAKPNADYHRFALGTWVRLAKTELSAKWATCENCGIRDEVAA